MGRACGAGNDPRRKVPSQDILPERWLAKNHTRNHLLYPSSILRNLLYWRPANLTSLESSKSIQAVRWQKGNREERPKPNTEHE